MILTRSARLFAENGYAGASIMMIARACGVSKALLYHYYRDKEAVLFDIIESHLTYLIEVVEGAARGYPLGRLRLDAMCGALLEAYRDADAQHQVQISNLKLLPAKKQAVLKALERRLVQLFAETLAPTVPELARDRATLKVLTMSLFAMLNWHYLWFREDGKLTRGEYARLAAELIVAGARSVSKKQLSQVT